MNSFLELIYEINSEFLHPNVSDLGLNKAEIYNYLY